MSNVRKIGVVGALTLLVASIVMLVAAINISRLPGDTSVAAKRAGRILTRRMAVLESYAQKAASGDCTQWMDVEGLPDDMVIYRYCGDTLQSWAGQFKVPSDDISVRVYVPLLTSPDVIIESPLLQVKDSVSYICTGPAWYLTKSIQADNCLVIAGLEVDSDSPLPDGEKSRSPLKLGDRFSIQTLDYSGGSEVIIEGRPQFKIACESLSESSRTNATFIWISLLLLLAASFVYLASGRSLKRFGICTAVVLVATLAVYIWGRTVQNQFSMFSPSLYAGDDILNSLGAVLLVNLAIFLVSLFVYMVRRKIAAKISADGRRKVFFGMTVALMAGILVYAHFCLGSIVRNSNISLELYKFVDLDYFTVLVYVSFLMLLTSVLLLGELLPLLSGKKWKLEPMSLPVRALFGIAVAIYLVFMTSSLSFRKESNRTEVWANRLLLNRDIQFEMGLKMMENQISEDVAIGALAQLSNTTNSIRSRVSDYLSRISQQYSASIYVFNEYNRTRESSALYNSIINGGSPISDNSRFLYVENGGSYPYYVGVFLYFDQSGTDFSTVLVKLESRSSGESRGYGGIFGFTPPGKFNLPDGYSYGRYVGHDLKSYSGPFAYPTSLSERRYLQVFQTHSSLVRTDGYVHFGHVVADNEAVIISRKQVSPLSYVIAVVVIAIVAFLMLSLVSIGRTKRRNTLGKSYYRKRISVVLSASLTLTLVAMAAVSVVFVYSRNETNLSDMMSDRINSISTMMNTSMRDISSLEDVDLQSVRRMMERIGSNTSTDMTLYTTGGQVVMSTTPMVFDRQMMGGRIDGTAFDHIMYMHNRYYIQKESRGPRRFYYMYAPVLGADNTILAILSAPYTDERYDFEGDAIMHTLTIFSIFLLFLMAALFLVSRVVDRMFSPLSEMSRKMNSADINALEPVEYNRDDEIYPIVQAYNRMTVELSESSRKLAQAERDKAWSSMARQVAHEIKNPLTPMKLKLQGVIRLKQKGDPAWQTRFDEASSVILDHIDILTETANEFSTFAKLYTEEPTSIDLYKVLEEEISMFDNKDNITFDYYGLRDVVVEGPKPQLTRVFVNLINNSVQAIGESEGGRILVSLRKSSDDMFYDIVFEDNGPGVSEENVERLFTPNFTTKNGGSGLGLAISRSVLEKCGATICYSRSFTLGGACFTIKYPKQQ